MGGICKPVGYIEQEDKMVPYVCTVGTRVGDIQALGYVSRISDARRDDKSEERRIR